MSPANSPPPTSRGGRRWCPPRSRSTCRAGRTSTPGPVAGRPGRRCVCSCRWCCCTTPRSGLPGRQRRRRQVGPGVRHGLARLGHARRRLRRAERVEPEDPLDLRRHRSRHLGGRRVVVAGLAGRQAVLRDRGGERRLDLRHRARDGQRQPGRRRRTDCQPLPSECGGDPRDVAGVGPNSSRTARASGSAGTAASAGRRPPAPRPPARRGRGVPE